MEDLNCWQSKFKPCPYSDRLINKIELLNKHANNKVDLIEVKKAIYYAKKYHAAQIRLSGEPYYIHPLIITEMVADYIFKTEILVTSILHDTIEDTELTKGMIEYIFDLNIANKVDDLTRNKNNQKISSAEILKVLWYKKKYELLIVKQMDRLHNMQSIFVKEPIKIKKIVSETIEIFLILSVHLGFNNVESQLTKLCADYFPKLSLSDEFHRFLTAGENVQLLAPIFQNEVIHNHNLCLKEKI